MTSGVDVIKNDGKRTEKFARDKLHKSVVSACTEARTPDGQATRIASDVCDELDAWLAEHQEITTRDIKKQASDHLRRRHPEAAYLYEQHHMII